MAVIKEPTIFFGDAAKGETEKDRMFIKSFLIDGSDNVNRWGLNAAHIKDHLDTFIGKPLVLTPNYDHPTVPPVRGEGMFDFLNRLFQHQEQYRIGSIKEIQEKDGAFYAISEITNAAAKEAIRTKNVPFYVSPSVYMLNPAEADDDIKTYTGVHLAVVDDPAYTVKKARIDNTCTGEAGACLAQLRNAKVEPVAFTCACPGKLLSALVDSSTKAQEQSTISMSDDIKALQTEITQLKEANKTLQTENEKLKLTKGETEEALKQLSASVDSLKKEARREKIAGILAADLFENAEAREAKIAKFTESNLSIEEIADTFGKIKEAKLKVAKADKPNFTASNGQKNAKTEPKVPEFLAYSQLRIRS